VLGWSKDEEKDQTYIQPILMTSTTRHFVLTLICRFQTMRLGMGIMMRSMKMLRAQLDRMNVLDWMHCPPKAMTFPLASY
jgi:hypothetical protein